MRQLADSPTARATSRLVRLRRAFTVEPTAPKVVDLVADDEVDCASIVASSLAWRRRYGLRER